MDALTLYMVVKMASGVEYTDKAIPLDKRRVAGSHSSHEHGARARLDKAREWC